MKKLFYLFGLIVLTCCYSISANGLTKIAVDSGTNHIKAALLTANDGDVLVLKMGETYTEDTLNINKNITIMGESFSALPKLENLPIIKKARGGNGVSWAFINLGNGSNLTLQYVAIDNNLGETMIRPDPRDTGAVGSYNRTIAISVDHCRLYNVGNVNNYSGLTSNMGDVFDIPQDSLLTKRKCKTILSKCYFTNNLIYNIAGRGIYLKDYSGPSDVVIENNTFSNIGQQLTLPRFYKLIGESDPNITISFSNNTCWKLSANTNNIKEFISNWNGLSPLANCDIPAINWTVKNNIFSHQIIQNSTSTPEFYNVAPMSIDETNLLLNIFNDCGPVYLNETTSPGSGNGINKIDTDPEFADTTSNDFTLGNLQWVADNKATNGAVYWAPGYVDVGPTSINTTQINSFGIYPNPAIDNVYISLNLKQTSAVQIEVVNLDGQVLKTVRNGIVSAGSQNFTYNVSELKTGVYLLKLTSNGSSQYTKLIKK